jgi:hypothetical protein
VAHAHFGSLRKVHLAEEQPDLPLQVTAGMNQAQSAALLIWLRFVEVGRLRIGAFQPVQEHGPRSCDCDIGDASRSAGCDPVEEIA